VDSPFSAGAILDAAGVVDDAVKLLKHVHPPRPVFVGLSIGGLFAAQPAGTLPRIRPAPGLALAVGGHDRRPAVSLVAVKYGALRITAITMFMGAVGLWVVVGIFWKIWVNPAALFDRPPEQVTALLTIALWNTTITQFLWIGGLAAVPDITRGSYLFFLKPVIAAVLAVVFLSQQLTAWQVVAILVICSSVAVEALWARFKPA
jgi:drug/metabolite transporter (DMT)-like permease